MNKINEDSQRSKSVLRKSSRIIRLPGDNSRDAEAPKPWSKAESLMRLLTERLPSGFSVNNVDPHIEEETFDFEVSFPLSGETVTVSGVGKFEADWEKPYKASWGYAGGEPGGGGWDIGVSFDGNNLFFEDEDGKNVKVDSKQVKEIIRIIEKNFEDEIIDRLEDDLEDYRTAYKGD